MKNIAIIYHSADFDGTMSNEVCRYWLSRQHPDAAIHSYGWDYGQPVPTVFNGDAGGAEEGDPTTWLDYDVIYSVDLSVDELMARPELRDKIVWIDHHKSAMEKWDVKPSVGGMGGSVHDWETSPDPFHQNALPDEAKHAGTSGHQRDGWMAIDGHGNSIGWQPKISGYRIDGVAACRLCWQWFSADGHNMPTKQDFIDRRVSEPELIRLAGEYDIWDHRDPDAKILQFGLRAVTSERLKELIEDEFAKSADGRKSDALWKALSQGRTIKAYCDRQNDEYAAAYAHTITFEGLTFCALNIGQRGNSDLLRAAIKPEHDALFAWRYDGKQVMVSLYHAPGREHHDLSLIATKYGGGGHKGACGFRCGLTFLNEILNHNPS